MYCARGTMVYKKQIVSSWEDMLHIIQELIV